MKKIRLLLADDNSDLLQLLACLLSDRSQIVGTVQDGRALLTAAAELRPDVVISDIDMPIVNGFEAARQLWELLPHTKIILMSGHDDSEHVAGAFASGACAFVSKGKTVDLRNTFNAILRTVLPYSTPEEPVGHGVTTWEYVDSWEKEYCDMRPDEVAISMSATDFHAVRCLLCRRTRPAESSARAASEWDELPGLLHRYHIRLPEVVMSDTYCEECAVFYRQLLTYGHPGQGLGGWITPAPSIT